MICRKTLLSIFYFGFLSLLCACGSKPPIKPKEPLYSAEQLHFAGEKAYLAGNYLDAISMFQESLNHYRRIDKHEKIVQLLINLSKACLTISRNNLAFEYINELTEHLKYSSSMTHLKHFKLLQSEYFIQSKNFIAAENTLSELLNKTPVQDAVGSSEGSIKRAALINRAIIAVERGDQDQAFWVEQIGQLGVKSQLESARLLRIRGQYEVNQQHLDNAEHYYFDALAHYRKAMFPPGIAASLSDIGNIYNKNNELQKAKYYFTKALQIRLLIGDSNQSRILLKNLQKIEAKQAIINDNFSADTEKMQYFDYLIKQLESK